MLVVTAFKDGSIIRQSVSNPEFGSIQVKDNGLKLNNGFLQVNNSPAFIRGKVEDLKKMNLKAGTNLATVLGEQKIVIKESTTPFFDRQNPKVNPTTGAIVTHKGSPVFRQTELVQANAEVCDTLLPIDTADVTIGSTAKTEHEEIKN